jgi:hypothetical protein
MKSPGRLSSFRSLTVSSLLLTATSLAAAGADDGFQSLFDGRSLTGWETPEPTYWSIEEGAITGRITKEHPCATNQYLVWTGGELADFELKLKSRVRGEGGINNGFQFRSRVLPDHDVCGYQMDNNLQTDWLARLYDEFGRHTLAWRGERAVFDAEGKRQVNKLDAATGPAWFKLEEWHEYHLVCVGRRIALHIDGRLAAEVEDNDARRFEPQGILALQLHSGPPTTAQFKEIRLKILKPAGKPGRPVPLPTADRREQLRSQAVAWWLLDTGGHGANPPLRHIPGWEKFELNVRAAGTGARPGTDVVLLDGAYFDAGPELHGGAAAVTVYLRARDPRGAWNGGLFAKRGGHDHLHFNLFGVDLEATPGPDVGFEIRTDRGFAQVSFPVSQIDPAAWHDLVGRYDGKSLDLFCDGRRLSTIPWSGELVRNTEPLLIGAETDNGKVVRHFHGELEEAALWSRALTEEEIAALSGIIGR